YRAGVAVDGFYAAAGPAVRRIPAPAICAGPLWAAGGGNGVALAGPVVAAARSAGIRTVEGGQQLLELHGAGRRRLGDLETGGLLGDPAGNLGQALGGLRRLCDRQVFLVSAFGRARREVAFYIRQGAFGWA